MRPPARSSLTRLPPDYREYSWSASLRRAGAEAGKNIAALLSEIIPPSVADEARARGPATAAQNLAPGAKPRLGIFFVRIDGETRVGKKISCSPLPDISNHLAATEDAVAGGQGTHGTAAYTESIQVRAFRNGRLITPREAPLAIQSVGCQFPLGFGGKAPLGPLAI